MYIEGLENNLMTIYEIRQIYIFVIFIPLSVTPPPILIKLSLSHPSYFSFLLTLNPHTFLFFLPSTLILFFSSYPQPSYFSFLLTLTPHTFLSFLPSLLILFFPSYPHPSYFSFLLPITPYAFLSFLP